MMIRRRLIDLFGTLLAALAILLLACAPAPSPPEVEYNGCRTVSFPGPRCALWPGLPQLKLWVRTDPGTEVEIRADGERLAVTGEESQGGRRFKLPLKPETSSLTVWLRRPGEALSSPWSLTLVPLETRKLARGAGPLSEKVYEATRQARIYMDGRRFAEARKVLADLAIPAGAPAESLYLVAFDQGLLAERLGDYGSARENLQQASDLAERGGMDGLRLDSGQLLARVLEELGRSKEAENQFTRLNAVRFPASMTPCEIGTFLTNEAWSQLLAREGGEGAADPTALLKRAQALFEAPCAHLEQRLNARLNLALAAQQAKRWPAARQALNEVEAPSLVSHANLEERLWGLDLKGRQAIAEGHPEDALALYGQLAAAAGEARSIEEGFRAAVGRANAQQALGQPEAAVASFNEADRLIDEQTLRIPISDGRDTFVGQRELTIRRYLKLLLDLGRQWEAFELVRRDRSRLLRQLEVRDRLASLTSDQQRLWDQAMSRYWTLHARIDQEAAAEGLLPGDELKRATESRVRQLGQARRELDGAMAELGDLGNRGEEHSSPPGPGEVILAYHPLPEGWAGFATAQDGIRVSLFDLPADVLADPGAPRFHATLASKLIEPFQSLLARASLARVLPFGPLRAVDFHALPLAGRPLLARLAVVYGLDVPTRPMPPAAGSPVALLVADPEGNLPEARKESRSAAETIRGQGWTSKLLEGKEASAGKVRGALPGIRLFEFAGHGELAGFAGWDSALRLAKGSRLTSRDVLTLRAPPWVVLSTCEGGLSSQQAPGEGIGLAQAFLLAGSQAVVAAVRPVRDSTARAFVAGLHRYWQPGTDLVQPFRRAQLACLQENPNADCASFRLFAP